MALWVIRILFLSLCTVGGYAVSQVRPEYRRQLTMAACSAWSSASASAGC